MRSVHIQTEEWIHLQQSGYPPSLGNLCNPCKYMSNWVTMMMVTPVAQRRSAFLRKYVAISCSMYARPAGTDATTAMPGLFVSLIATANASAAYNWRVLGHALLTHSVLYGDIYLGQHYPESKVHVANMGPTWVPSALGGHYVGPMNLATRVVQTMAFCLAMPSH